MKSKYEGCSVEELRTALNQLWNSPELDCEVFSEDQEKIIDELEEIVNTLRNSPTSGTPNDSQFIPQVYLQVRIPML